MNFNAMDDDDPVQYEAFVSTRVSDAAAALKAANGDRDSFQSAVRAFLTKGYDAALTSGELTDFFCVDSPSVIDRAELNETQADEAVKLFDQINEQLYSKRKPSLPVTIKVVSDTGN